MARAPPTQHPGSPWSDPAVVLPGHQLEQVNKLQRELASCMSNAERTMICRQIRDSLLGEYRNLEILFAICRDVMEASGHDCTCGELDGSWRQFTQLAAKGAKLRAVRAKALQQVADRWGAEVTHHYGWGTIGHRYCQQLHAAAREMDWPTFVRGLNQALLDRHWAKSLNVHPIPALVNPIMQPDIEKVRSQAQPGKTQRVNKGPATEKDLEAGYKAAKFESESRYRVAGRLPVALGLDRFGVVVREEFDDPPTSLKTDGQDENRANSAPSTATSIASHRLPVGCTGLFPTEAARSLPSPLPADIRTALPSPPSPPSTPEAGTTPPLPTIAQSEPTLSLNGTYCKRAALTHSARPTKRQRTLLPWLGDTIPQSAGISPESNQPWYGSPERSVVKEILGKSRSCSPAKFWLTHMIKIYWPSSSLRAYLWLTSRSLSTSRSWWKKRLSGMRDPTERPARTLRRPTHYPRYYHQRHHYSRQGRHLGG